jgi:hypothetical protein
MHCGSFRYKELAQGVHWNSNWPEAFRLKIRARGGYCIPSGRILLPWPALATRIGDFVLYEMLLAGCGHTVVHGQLLDLSSLPQPEECTLNVVVGLRAKTIASDDERVSRVFRSVVRDPTIASRLLRSARNGLTRIARFMGGIDASEVPRFHCC